MKLVEQQVRAQQLGYAAMFPNAETGIIERDGVPIGYVMIAQTGADDLHLVDIALSSHARGEGAGTDVLRALIAAARDEGCRRMTLSVALANTAAERLYARLGFAFCDTGAFGSMTRDMALDL